MRIRPAELDGYEHVVEVGRSDRAVIFRCWQAAFKRNVAIHVLVAVTPEEFERDRTKMGTLAGHPNVVSVHEAGFTRDGRPYVVTDFFPGGSLADVRWEDTLTWEQATSIAVRLAGVLESARRAGITDLAVDPRSVFLSHFGEPQLSTFGVPATGSDLASLEETCAWLFRGARDTPEGFEAPAATADPLDFARRLRQAQAEAGVAVVEVPLALEQPVPGAPAAPDEVTLGPAESRTRRPLRVPLLGGLAAATVLLLVVLASQGDENRSALPAQPSTLVPTTSAAVPAAPGIPIDPPLLSVAFSPDQWRAAETPLGGRYEDGNLHLSLLPSAITKNSVRWRAPPDARRLSVSLEATVVAGESTDIGVSCAGPVLGIVRSDGTWTIQGGAGVLASGRSPMAPPKLGEPFVIRLDCALDRVPGHMSLWLNDTRLGTAVQQGRTEPDSMGYFAGVMPRASEAGEFILHRLHVRRLTDA